MRSFHSQTKLHCTWGKVINILRAICTTWWGADPHTHTLNIIFNGPFRSHLDYGRIVLDSGSKCIILRSWLNMEKYFQNTGDRSWHQNPHFKSLQTNLMRIILFQLEIMELKKTWKPSNNSYLVQALELIKEYKEFLYYRGILPCYRTDLDGFIQLIQCKNVNSGIQATYIVNII